jgi:type VI secretion system protein
MLRAFLDGAGLSGAAVEPGDPAASLHHYGEILRELISGVRELMATRALMKSEFRIEQTVIRVRDNNALKFSVDLEQALRAMLLPQGAGYAEPLAAAREAVADLKAHEIALIAGLEKAVARLLEALAPAELERSIEATGMLASVLPGARKARYWDAYGTLYKKLAEEIREDVHGVFRQSFAEAYSEQVKKL